MYSQSNNLETISTDFNMTKSENNNYENQSGGLVTLSVISLNGQNLENMSKLFLFKQP